MLKLYTILLNWVRRFIKRNQPIDYIILPGAWHTPSSLQELAANLQKGRNTATVIRYPRKNDFLPNRINFHAYVNETMSCIQRRLRYHGGRIVLVAHSSGGTIAQRVADIMTRHIDAIIYINAFVVPKGQSQLDQVDDLVADGIRDSVDSNGFVPVNEDYVRDILMPNASQPEKEKVLKTLADEHLSLFDEPVPLSEQVTGVPTAAIKLTKDFSMPPGFYLDMAIVNGGATTVSRFNGDHEAPVTQPKLLSGVIKETLRDLLHYCE